jgi:fatty acid desaturase
MADGKEEFKVSWYRVPIEKQTLRALTARSDWKGLLQTVSFLGLLAVTGAAAFYAWRRLPLGVFIAILFVHGTCFGFMVNAFHELCHGTVFKSRFLNGLFLRIVSFIGWNNYILFRTSHNRHHWHTLHPPHDLEVVLRLHFSLRTFLSAAVADPVLLYEVIKQNIRLSLGRLKPGWETTIFPASDPKTRRQLFRLARVMLAGHAIIVAASILTGLWPIALVITGAKFYGGWLFYLCNNTQHVGLRDNVPDFRLCCRTIELNPFLRFIYWHMNYHTEHHMYAAVPCYNLRKLHRAIAHEMPEISHGLIPAWREIILIFRRQKAEPGYQHTYQLPIPGGLAVASQSTAG